ncbi:hypothetical protein C8J57DRAFT_1242136 [Mycena rebaudengoi]|nr:hypothetical protein C8J57DRAFT_1242136 [Mycena rebaudengoi]
MALGSPNLLALLLPLSTLIPTFQALAALQKAFYAKWKHDHPPSQHARVRFEVDVVFSRAPLAVNNFWTDVEIFSQSVEDLGGVLFKTISLKSLLAPITVSVLRAENVKIANTVGSIRFETSSSPINVNLNLINGAERDITKARIFGLVVTAVAANITLDSPQKSSAAFDILTVTSFGSLMLDRLLLTYEGSFFGLTSPHSHARVEYDQARRDRKLEYDESRPGSVRGNILSAVL